MDVLKWTATWLGFWLRFWQRRVGTKGVIAMLLGGTVLAVILNYTT